MCSCWCHIVSNWFSLYIAGNLKILSPNSCFLNWHLTCRVMVFLMLKVLSQDDTPFLYSVVFGEGVVNDATSIVLFNAVQSLDVKNVSALTALNLLGTFLYLFFTSTLLGIAVSCRLLVVLLALWFEESLWTRSWKWSSIFYLWLLCLGENQVLITMFGMFWLAVFQCFRPALWALIS